MLDEGVSIVKIPNPIKSAIASAAFTFVTLTIAPVLGFLQALYGWVNSSGKEPLPDVSTLGWAIAAAALSVLAGLITGIFRWSQGRFDWIPGQPPAFQGGGNPHR